jgi:hypothetical protein
VGSVTWGNQQLSLDAGDYQVEFGAQNAGTYSFKVVQQ